MGLSGINKEETFGDFLKKLNITGNLDDRLEHINEEEDVKTLLAKKIEEDIQKYFSGEESVVVKVKDDAAYVVYDGHWMPTIDFYQFVYKNSGTVNPEDFENYENLL
jgi:hypothetical protein